ncbi:FtsK/SpoIIIE domain-containing protein [Ornithinimicrobium sp. LYQ92]|uniref:FtsK/SpoIIIE domain-containing protein n=1 Tax=Serinicoccus sp. LYQ92 TaxID=3378798 RepID=UPI0038554E73
MKVIVTRQLGGRVEHLAVQAPAGSTRGQLLRRLAGDPGDPDELDDRLEHGCDLSVPPPTDGMPSGIPWLVVAAGPDAGGAAPLPPGRWVVVGRGPACDLRIQDPGLSRRHLQVRQERDGVRVADLGSTNGMRWEQHGDGARWRPGDRLLAGGTALVLVARPAAPALSRAADGTRELTPWPRVLPALEPVEISTPSPAGRRAVRAPSSWTWSLPLVLALAVAVLLRMPWLLLFGLLGPAMVLGQYLGDRRAARAEHEEAVAAYRAQLTTDTERARTLLQDELDRRRARAPGLVGVLAALRPVPSTTLWERADEAHTVMLGEHRSASSVRLQGQLLEHEVAPLEHPLDRPLVLVGPAGARDGLARSLLLQLATGHPPGRWSLVLDPQAAPGPGWDLLGWLPHTVTDGRPPGRALVWGRDLLLVDTVEEAPAGVPRVLLPGAGPGSGTTPAAVLQVPGQPDVHFAPATVGLARARSLVRILAPLRCSGGDSDTTGAAGPLASSPMAAVRLGDLGPWPTSAATARSCWSAPGLQIPIGVDDHGSPVTIDLPREGPHALVAGTTGAGKSELLRTVVAALAIRCSPADLALLLVDFKGGSSLGDCAALPHVTGLVTDLDPHLAQRVLASLQAELVRREAVLAEAGVQDIDGYAGLPRLVVVIDEFRVLAEAVPEVMSGLVRLAAVGRSLGVHLILATQRPAGVVGADLRANVNLRIALRVRDASDSLDVIETAEAASLPQDHPGLALWRTGAERPRRVQVARVGPPTAGGTPDWTVTAHEDVWSARAYLERPPARRAGADDLGPLAAVLTEAAALTDATAPVVWHPPLPGRMPGDPDRPDAWACADLPSQQRRDLLRWEADTHLALVGSAGSGRSTALCSLLLRGLPCWLVVLDLGRTLAATPLSRHPGVCGWSGPDDLAHGLRLLDRLQHSVLTRQAEALTGPPLVLVLDGWDRFVDLFGEVERGRAVDTVLRVLREGPAVGVVAALTGDRSLLLGKVASLLPQTWALRLNDPADLLMTGLRPAQVPRDQPPGRMVGARDGVEAQVLLPPTDPRPTSPAGGPPFVCRPLPRRWAAPPGEDGWAVGGDEVTAVTVPGGSVLVLGPAGSGRTSTLRALLRERPALVVEGSSPPSQGTLTERLQNLPDGHLVVVDDAHLLAGTPTEDLLVEAAAVGRRDLLVAADTDAAAGSFRGLVPAAARGRTAVVLQPSAPGEGAVVGVRLPVGDVPVPGRGVLVRRGRCTRVQVAAPPGSATSRADP